ncbi:I66 family serine proteinase inhibitor [Nonomuraea sp. NEAU-A123]|uniref:I66 family serine proteinase inhibitor n=1 Tax=Nonomuraea sp. NEAU-A123 TaxID=2839649 RepID=UPI001BE45724|nr:I66 family serine proteinase inhibitor [Nonomuraea sp. NEAU-A123]MBT2232350.1 I66 family serine proteinase inhibitor [Nonomuraea sp. NEAU-A123]
MRMLRTRLAVLAATLAVALTPWLADASCATARQAPSPISGVVILKIGGGHVVNVGNKLFAALLPHPLPTKFRVVNTPEGVRFRDERTGGVVYADPSLEPFSQLSVSEPGQIPPYSTWILESPEGDADEGDELSAGAKVVTIKLAGTDQYIGRHFAEDRSLLPKRVLLLPPGVQAPLWTVESVG